MKVESGMRAKIGRNQNGWNLMMVATRFSCVIGSTKSHNIRFDFRVLLVCRYDDL